MTENAGQTGSETLFGLQEMELNFGPQHPATHGVLRLRLKVDGERIAGYKIGFTNIAVRDKMGLPDSTYGYLMESMVEDTGGHMAMDEMIAPKIETEICLRLGQDLDVAAPSAGEVQEAVDAARASFEVCDARILDWKCPYPDFFADNGFSARIVL